MSAKDKNVYHTYLSCHRGVGKSEIVHDTAAAIVLVAPQ